MTDKPANIMTIQDLLRGKHHGFDTTDTDRIKMIRLKSDRKEIMIGGKLQKMELLDIYKYHRDQFEEYFKEETKPIFDDVEYVVVFLAEDGWNSRLVGVYENKGKDLKKSKQLNLNYYKLVALSEFEFLTDRVIVDWGEHNENINQGWKNIKYVTRIDGYVDKHTPRFDSYENVMLGYSDLQAIINGNDEVWRRNLQSVNCVYCIVDKSKGKLYIGSTYNKTAGIWERWKEYATSIDGFAEELKKLIVADPNYVYNFQWIILEVLPLKVSKEKAIGRESFYKEKFCTREHGYNLN